MLQLVLSTDASGVAWGAHIHGKWQSSRQEGKLLLDDVDKVHLTEPVHLPAERKNMRGEFSGIE